MLLVSVVGCLVAELIYTLVVFHAIEEGAKSPKSTHSTC